MIDTHAHLDAEEFDADRDDVLARIREAGVNKVFLPAIDLPSSRRVVELSRQHPGFLYPMVGLHPEEVRADWREQLAQIHDILLSSLQSEEPAAGTPIAIGEVGLDYYWSREFEKEQLEAFEEQVRWSVETRLPLMIHCRKAQNEMVALLKHYRNDLPGGVFHCFTGNALEAEQLLQFDRFVLGIGGVFTFKKSPLPEVLPQVVPLDRIVLETDSPYMAPVPMRGKRNESSYIPYILRRLAEAYGTDEHEVNRITDATATRVLFPYIFQ